MTVTWEASTTGRLWEIGGASGTQDRDPVVAGRTKPGALGEMTVPLNKNGVALVQSWVDHPSRNFGLLIAATAQENGLDFASREWPNASQRPRLTIDFTKP